MGRVYVLYVLYGSGVRVVCCVFCTEIMLLLLSFYAVNQKEARSSTFKRPGMTTVSCVQLVKIIDLTIVPLLFVSIELSSNFKTPSLSQTVDIKLLL